MQWYVRNKDKVIGPFPTGQIQQAVLLGRISTMAEVSRDREEWTPLRRYPELIPDVMKDDASDEHVRERLAAARRWADERRRERRLDDDPVRQGPGRRNHESYTTLSYRDNREAVIQSFKPSQEKVVLVMLFVLILLGAGVYAGVHWVPKALAPPPQCDAIAAPGVNWRQCDMAGLQLLNAKMSKARLNSANLQGANLFGSVFRQANLSYADLSSSNLSFTDFQNARLKGANLRASDLSKANFTEANLSYADLKGAKITDTQFTRANLSNAIWIDGRICLKGSVGVCRFAH